MFLSTGLRPSSTVKLRLFRHRIHIGHLMGHLLIGEYEEYVGNVLSGQGQSGAYLLSIYIPVNEVM